jgi:hypothetical protein
MTPKKNTKRKDPPPPAEEGATDPANELAEPPSSDYSSGDSSCDDNDWPATVAAANTAAAASAAVVARAAMATTLMFSMLQQLTAQRMKTDHQTLPRNNRRDFRHGDALRCIQRDYTGLKGDPRTPLLENFGIWSTSPYLDYFQMSPQFASSCCKHFCKAVKLVYQNTFLRGPTKADIKKIIRPHKVVPGVEGLNLLRHRQLFLRMSEAVIRIGQLLCCLCRNGCCGRNNTPGISLSNFFAFLLPIGHARPTPMAAVILFIAAGLFSPLSPAFFFFA